MTLTELKYLTSLARERHFGRAAAACHVSQPTLSTAIRKLEDQIGLPLFERGGELLLTHAGELLVSQAHQVLLAAQDWQHLAEGLQDELKGPLRLGLIFTIAPYLLPSLIPSLQQSTPQMPLWLEESTTAHLLERLAQGELDAAIMAEPVPAEFRILPLYEEALLLAVPALHPWATRQRVQASELADEPLLLLPPGHCLRDQILDFCSDSGKPSAQNWQQSLAGGSMNTLVHMVAGGLGVTLLPQTASLFNPAGLKLIAFDEPVPKRRVVLVSRPGFARPKALMRVKQTIAALPLPDVSGL